MQGWAGIEPTGSYVTVGVTEVFMVSLKRSDNVRPPAARAPLVLDGVAVIVTVGRVVSAVTEPVIEPKLVIAVELLAASVIVKFILFGVTAPVSPDATVKTIVSPEELDAEASLVTAVAMLFAVEALVTEAVTTSL